MTYPILIAQNCHISSVPAQVLLSKAIRPKRASTNRSSSGRQSQDHPDRTKIQKEHLPTPWAFCRLLQRLELWSSYKLSLLRKNWFSISTLATPTPWFFQFFQVLDVQVASREQGNLHVQSQHLLQDSQDQSSLNRKKNDISPCSHASLVPPHADAVLADDDLLTNAGYLRLTWHFPPWAARCKAYGGINKRNSHSRARRLSLQPCSSRNPCINVIKRYQNLSSYTELCCIKITIPCSPCQSATHHRL